jgi:hypothetical protein
VNRIGIGASRPTSFFVVRRTAFALAVLAAVVGGFLASGPASSGVQPEGQLVITKVVDGAGPTGGYVIDYECIPSGGTDAPEGPPGGSGSGSLNFDAAGPGAPETQAVVLDGPSVCTVTETNSNGADEVSYTCDFVTGTPPASDDEALPEGELPQGCLTDQSGGILFEDDQLTITVTNVFDPEVLPDDDEPEPPAVAPDVVAGSPSFTG